jgi:hypothetical protein
LNKIFGVGLNKTGTYSLYKALETLGYSCYHFSVGTHHPKPVSGKGSPIEEWRTKLVRGVFNFEFLKHYDAIVDTPIPAIYKQLDLEYPDSKFILTTRDYDSWITSEERHLKKLQRLENSYLGTSKGVFEHFLMYNDWGFNEAKMKFAWNYHHNEVKDYFSSRLESLLILDLNDPNKWELLSGFLNKKVPDVNYPHLNAG